MLRNLNEMASGKPGAVQWHSVVIFNENLAKVAEQYLKKGAKVYIEGSLQTRKWTDQQGNDKYTTEIVLQKFRGELQMLDSRGSNDDAERERSEYRSNQQARNHPNTGGGSFTQDLDDDIPFAPEWR